MKEYSPGDIQDEMPELWIEIERAMDIILPDIIPNIKKVLDEKPNGTGIGHSSFFQIGEEQTGKIFYIEMQIDFAKAIKLPVIVSLVNAIIIYDDEEAYNAARNTIKLIGHQFPADNGK